MNGPLAPTRTAAPVHTRWRRRAGAAALTGAMAVLGVLALPGDASAAAPPVGLGTAASYSVLAASTVTNTGPSTLSGDLGLSPGTAITGFPPGIVAGAVHAADADATQAQVDLTTAYNDAAGRTATGGSLGAALTGRTLTPGVYTASSALDLGGPITLDAQGDPSAVFIFQIGSALTTDSASSVIVTNGAQACNVFWQVGSSATLGTGSTFIGTIMAHESVTVTTGTTVQGRAMASTGAVTLDSDVFTTPSCDTTTPTSSAPASTAPSTGSSAGAGASGATGAGTGTNGAGTGSTGTGRGAGQGAGTAGPTGTGPTGTGAIGSLSALPPGLANTGPDQPITLLLILAGVLLGVGGLMLIAGRGLWRPSRHS